MVGVTVLRYRHSFYSRRTKSACLSDKDALAMRV